MLFQFDAFAAARSLRFSILHPYPADAATALEFFRPKNPLLFGEASQVSENSTTSSASLRDICVSNHSALAGKGPLAIYEAILATFDLDHTVALDSALLVLRDGTPQAYLDDFEHPALWAMAAAHRLEADPFSKELTTLETDTGMGAKLGPEGKMLRQLFIVGSLDPTSNETTAYPMEHLEMLASDCRSVGCRYFKSQFLLGFGFWGEAERLISRGYDFCEGEVSIGCAWLRHARSRIMAGKGN